MRNFFREKKRIRPKTASTLSEREARRELERAESLYVLGINSAYVEQVRKAFEAKYGICPKKIYAGEPSFGTGLCAKVSFPSRPGRVSDVRMQLFFA